MYNFCEANSRIGIEFITLVKQVYGVDYKFSEARS